MYHNKRILAIAAALMLAFSHDTVSEEVGKSAKNYTILLNGLLDSLAEK